MPGAPPADVEPAAYGARLPGLRSPWLALADVDGWPPLTVVLAEHAQLDSGLESHGDSERALFTTVVGHVELDRAARTVSMRAPDAIDGASVVHPGLWPAAATFARWDGLETLHAGAFRRPGEDGAWIVMADRGGGKSTLLAALALAGVEVLADDLVVLDGVDCRAGPRCVDLRPEAADALGVDVGLTEPVRATSRRRLSLPACAGTRPIAGFVSLRWGAPRAERLTPSETFAELGRHRRIVWLGADPALLLGACGLPAIRLSRPRRWQDADRLAAQVLSRLPDPR